MPPTQRYPRFQSKTGPRAERYTYVGVVLPEPLARSERDRAGVEPAGTHHGHDFEVTIGSCSVVQLVCGDLGARYAGKRTQRRARSTIVHGANPSDLLRRIGDVACNGFLSTIWGDTQMV